MTLAQKLLGNRLVRILETGERLAGTIVETEAYLGVEDRAAHTFGGRRTPRNEAMYGAAGTAYVYFTYGMHYCLNVVAGRVGEPVAVLIRALEPTEGLETMRRLRARPVGAGVKMGKTEPDRPGESAHAIPDKLLCSGPGRLCHALRIDRQLNGIDLTADSRLWIERIRPRGPDGFAIGNSHRIGVDYAGPWAHERLRWFLSESDHVSGKRTGSPGRKKVRR